MNSTVVYVKQVLWLFFILLGVSHVQAAPFESCSGTAYLVQSSPARVFGVNLATGFYSELETSMGTTKTVNAMGFNVADNYLYGFSSQFRSVVRIGNDFQIETLNVTGLPNTSFYVGDTSVVENSYYVYRPGRNYGLYKVALDETSPDYLVAQRIINGTSLNLAIYDFAFHPSDAFIYGVTRTGSLVKIDASNGSYETLGNVGETGTFGAVYFDGEGNFYISRNSDGFVFRIDVSSPDLQAQFYAFGPSSSSNDGARCATASIISEDSTVDFGEAPDSYGTSIESNGARHEMTPGLLLGDISGGDNDGVDFVTGLETGLSSLINVNVAGDGILNMWVDWDQNGVFDETDQIIVDRQMEEGENRILIDIPSDASEGDTWARVRYSSQAGIGATGGVADGEVEDYMLYVSTSGVSIVSYPSSGGVVTLAYEDNWPERGDYDMNDVVLSYKTRKFIDENNRVVRYDIEGSLLAMGADYHNGFAVQLDGIATDNIAQELIRYEINGVPQVDSALEQNAADDSAVIIVTEDLWDRVVSTPSCKFYRTSISCEAKQTFDFVVNVPLVSSVALADAPTDLLNPFIFAAPGHYHGDTFTSQPGRSLEIHLKNKITTVRFNNDLFGTNDDFSDPENGLTFVSDTSMPWALEMPTLWSHPLERTDLTSAYPDFVDFVRTKGRSSGQWFAKSRSQSKKIISN